MWPRCLYDDADDASAVIDESENKPNASLQPRYRCSSVSIKGKLREMARRNYQLQEGSGADSLKL